jgi:hypothetical protein
VRIIQRFHCLRFNDGDAFDWHISGILPDDGIVVPGCGLLLLCHARANLRQLLSLGILVDLPKKSDPTRIHNAERVPNDALGYSVQCDFIPVHRRFRILVSNADRESSPKR